MMLIGLSLSTVERLQRAWARASHDQICQATQRGLVGKSYPFNPTEQIFFEQHFTERKHIVRHFSISLHFTLLYQKFVYA